MNIELNEDEPQKKFIEHSIRNAIEWINEMRLNWEMCTKLEIVLSFGRFRK